MHVIMTAQMVHVFIMDPAMIVIDRYIALTRQHVIMTAQMVHVFIMDPAMIIKIDRYIALTRQHVIIMNLAIVNFLTQDMIVMAH